MPLTLAQTIPPITEPVSVPELKAHLRIETADEDALLASLISVAREDIELYLRRQCLPATWMVVLDAWPTDARCPIRLPRPPAQALTSIVYYDSSGVLQTLPTTVYQVDLVSEPARVLLAEGQTWPSLQSDRLNAIRITYVAGYASAYQVPAGIRHAIKLLAGDLYENREGQLQLGGGLSRVEENPTLARLLWKFRLLEV